MSDAIKHECGIAMVRLLKPLEYYRKKYGDVFWGMNKLYLLMEKQHNRGQEGAGMASVKLNARPGEEYIFRERAEGTGAIQDIFSAVHRAITECRRIEPEVPDEELPFIGEMYMGHLRYSTTGRSGISYLHPFLRRNNWRSRNLSLAGNFNLTNVDEILQYIVERGQHPRHNADTFIILEQLGYLLDLPEIQGRGPDRSGDERCDRREYRYRTYFAGSFGTLGRRICHYRFVGKRGSFRFPGSSWNPACFLLCQR